MPWKQRGNCRYYVRNERQGRRVRSIYIGTGDLAAALAELDASHRERRQQDHADAHERRRALAELAQPPAACAEYLRLVRAAVADVLTGMGFHQHKRQWRKKRMSDQAGITARRIYVNRAASPDDLRELRRLVSEHAQLARSLGDVAIQARHSLLASWDDLPTMGAAIEATCERLERQLGCAEATEIERLVIDEIVLCWLDYNRVLTCYAQQTATFRLSDMEQWATILASHQRRYLRSIETLARIRRLLKLPTLQVNVALDGGQQVNVVEHTT